MAGVVQGTTFDLALIACQASLPHALDHCVRCLQDACVLTEDEQDCFSIIVCAISHTTWRVGHTDCLRLPCRSLVTTLKNPWCPGSSPSTLIISGVTTKFDRKHRFAYVATTALTRGRLVLCWPVHAHATSKKRMALQRKQFLNVSFCMAVFAQHISCHGSEDVNH